MGCINDKLSESNENPQIVEFNETSWNCVTSKALLACYFEHFKEEEENRDGTIRSKSKDKKELTCSPEEYQQSAPILMENTWHEQLCKCFNCLQIYHKQNLDFLFGIKTMECLPIEILLKIFKHLRPADRRVISECCKRFLDIWLCDDFADDRHLVFDKCVLDPEREPLSVFKKSTRNYRSLAFGDVIISKKLKFTGKFWENITTVELMNSVTNEHANEMLSLLSTFPNLKTFKVVDIDLLGNFSTVPTTIELLAIYGIELFEVDELNKLKRYLDTTCDSFRVELNDKISLYDIISFTDSQRNKIQQVHLSFYEHDDAFKLPRFDNLKYFELVLEENCDYGTKTILDNLEEQCPAMKDLSITIRRRLPHKNWTCLKTLEARYVPKAEMSRISIFENLKELTLKASGNKCFFVHEPFLNKNLKKLKIDSSSKVPCFSCFQTMINSFPNLESLTCDFFQITNIHLEELANNTPKLKCLTLNNVDVSISFACLPNLTKLKVSNNLTLHLIETWPIMVRLRKLRVHLSRLNFETLKIFERTPALEDLSIRCDFIDDDQLALFDALTKPLKQLKAIYFRCDWIEPEIYPEIIDVMANNCKYLRRINFHNHRTGESFASKKILKQLLQKYSSIRCIDGVWLK